MATLLQPKDRPSDRILAYGTGMMTDAEILCALLYPRRTTEDHMDTCRKMLSEHENLFMMLKNNNALFSTEKGKKMPEFAQMTALRELIRRFNHYSGFDTPKVQISQSSDISDLMRMFFYGETTESFYVILLNRSNRVQRIQKISEGGMTGTVADPKIIMFEALKYRAAAIVLSHNHPSGNSRPSEADIQLTRKMKEASRVLEIQLLDHVIMTDNSYYSFADEGMI